LSVLAIDDNPLDLQSLKRIFCSSPEWEVHFEGFANSAPTLEQIEQIQPDIIFLDYHLAGEVDVEVLKALRSLFHSAHHHPGGRCGRKHCDADAAQRRQ
jgi:DNA-binding NarL/FixJ family response regulator